MQEKLPYHINGVRSNDELFAEAEFKTEVVNYINKMVELIEGLAKSISTLTGLDGNVGIAHKK